MCSFAAAKVSRQFREWNGIDARSWQNQPVISTFSIELHLEASLLAEEPTAMVLRRRCP
jgi:hypothetical protein